MVEIQGPPLPGEFGQESQPPPRPLYTEQIPPELRASTSRLSFPPSYVIVGVYRLLSDKSLYVPAWKKCQHGFVRGATVGLVWAVATFKIQRKFIELFLIRSPRVTGLSRDAVFGITLPFDLLTYATIVFLSNQVTSILTFFLSRNIRIARDRVYNQTVESRGKGPDFWKPYVEEWAAPPVISDEWKLSSIAGSTFGVMAIRLALIPFHVVPLLGVVISSWLRSFRTARLHHETYFKAKSMTPSQIAVFVEERKWQYRTFGFAAALLESIPIVGLVFTVSNRIGAAMWAHDLEKRQHFVAEQKAKVSK